MVLKIKLFYSFLNEENGFLQIRVQLYTISVQ